jgi:uncharacterized protein
MKGYQMIKTDRPFQVFAKPISCICNLSCHYCYYLKTKQLYPVGQSFRMPDDILEKYLIQHINASSEPVIRFSWHGGEPTLLGLDYFRKIVALQRKHHPPNQQIANGIQTNGTLLDAAWCRFLATEGFAVGLSLDGPQEMHDKYRVTKNQKSTYKQTMRGYHLLQTHGVNTDILCVVNRHNVHFPIQVYRFFKQLKAQYINFLPLVKPQLDTEGSISSISVPAEAWGRFLCTIFDEWRDQDIGHVTVQMYEEAVRTAFHQEHSLCIFQPTCGDIPVVEHNGDVYSCDHYVDREHYLGNITDTLLVELLESPRQRAFGTAKWQTLPRYCQECEVRTMCNGGCPKNRVLRTPSGAPGLNYLCSGYKRFFMHCQSFVSAVADIWRRQTLQQQTPADRVTGREPASSR